MVRTTLAHITTHTGVQAKQTTVTTGGYAQQKMLVITNLPHHRRRAQQHPADPTLGARRSPALTRAPRRQARSTLGAAAAQSSTSIATTTHQVLPQSHPKISSPRNQCSAHRNVLRSNIDPAGPHSCSGIDLSTHQHRIGGSASSKRSGSSNSKSPGLQPTQESPTDVSHPDPRYCRNVEEQRADGGERHARAARAARASAARA